MMIIIRMKIVESPSHFQGLVNKGEVKEKHYHRPTGRDMCKI